MPSWVRRYDYLKSLVLSVQGDVPPAPAPGCSCVIAELFLLATCSRKLLGLRYDLGRWKFNLDDDTYEIFCAMRHSVPLCFEATGDFDLVAYLGSRLSAT
ncbi:hypothetical protein B484DRAFT_410126, partial [Ochromonadaceae sp. CCMP2298]